jgi:hypothetical protein
MKSLKSYTYIQDAANSEMEPLERILVLNGHESCVKVIPKTSIWLLYGGGDILEEMVQVSFDCRIAMQNFILIALSHAFCLLEEFLRAH